MLLPILFFLFLSLPGFIGTFTLGLVAAYRAVRNEGEYTDTLVLFAFHMWEPVLTFCYIVLIEFVVPDSWQRDQRLSDTELALLWTIPMLMHVTALLGLRMHTPVYKLQTIMMFVLGGLRWFVSAMT